jgi:hypothetical protein|tara:strand:+ start:281 stop:2419 length:2139 start_codon:yes stop_codon:yes gene_type:complete
MAITIQEVRQKYPQYTDLTDKQLVDALHSKYYSDIPIDDFYNQVGLTAKEDIALEQPETGLQEERQATRRRTAADILRSAATGGLRGVTGLLGLPALGEQISPTAETLQQIPTVDPVLQLLKAAQRTGIVSGEPGVLFPSQQRIMAGVEQIPGTRAVTEYQPQTRLGEYAETIAEFAVPGGLFAKTPKALGTALGVGGVGGAVQETQEQIGLTPMQALPLTVVSTIASGYALSPNRAARYAKEATKGVSDEELALAASVERKANELGINITAPELIDNKILKGVGEIVYGSEKGGDIMYNYIKNRPQEINKVADLLMDEIIKKPESVRQVYKDIGTTADKAIRKAEQARRIQAEDAGYIVSNVENLDEAQIINVLGQIDEKISAFGQKSPNIKTLKDLKTRLTKDEANLIPETNINKLSAAMREFREKIADSKTGQADTRRFIDKDGRYALFNDDGTGILNNLDNQLRTNVSYKNAQDTFARLSDEMVQPVLDNVEALGKGVTPAKIKSFVFDPTKNNVNDIKQTYTILNKTDNEAFPNIARAYIENAANKAFITKPSGESLKSGFDLYKALAGTKNQRVNFNQVLKGVAEANGVNPNTLILGFNNFNEILKRTARIVNVDNPKMPPNAKNLPQTAAQIGSFMWRVKFASKYGEFLQQKTMQDLAKVFTSKNSVDELVKLAKTDLDSTEAVIRTVNIIAATSPFQEPEAPPE